MIKQSLAILLTAGIVATPAYANSASKEEGVGVGMGAVLGGVIGGPAGAIVGAAIGAKFGDEFHQRDAEVDSLTASLAGSRQETETLSRNITALEQELQVTQGELDETRELARPELLALLSAGIEMDLLFRTDEDVLKQSTSSRLAELAASLQAMPDVRVRLDGFADERGDEAYNRALSQRRAEHVRELLVANGVPAARITVNAHGESAADEATPDSYALERRVSLTLYLGDTPSFAASPRP